MHHLWISPPWRRRTPDGRHHNIEQWKTRFRHFAGLRDSIPCRFLPNSFRPFGTYFLVRGSSCACFDDPDSIVKLSEFGRAETNFVGYHGVLWQLNEKIKYRSSFRRPVNFRDILPDNYSVDSRRAGLAMQLAAAGIEKNHHQVANSVEGIEKANLILSTGVLQRSWLSVFELRKSPGLPFSVQKLPKATIIALRADQSQLAQEAQQPTLRPLDGTDPTLGFLATKRNPSVSFHSSPLSAFLSLLNTTDLKQQLKELTAKGQPRLILVGESLGGSVAALCTLSLLKNSPLLLPICITFGSPLLGDVGLQKAVSNIEQWKTQFWHVAGLADPIPRFFLPNSFRPFGTYFLVSGSSCACFDDPDSIVRLLESGSTETNSINYGAGSTETNSIDYGAVLRQLNEKSKYRSSFQLTGNFRDSLPDNSVDSLTAGLTMQLAAAGIEGNHQSELLQALEDKEREIHMRRTHQPNPSKRLNNVKKSMAQLEWYKEKCESEGMVYYDEYKKRGEMTDFDVKGFVDCLNAYWRRKVEEADGNPQAPDARMRIRWLFSGVTYMRMVEPLDIAEHYRRRRQQDYLSARSEHYKFLDKWNHEEAQMRRRDKPPSLTEDSCFWARVEEAKLKLDKLRTSDGGRELELKKELIEFEAHIMKLVNNYLLSPEVFLQESSFMEWWRQYEQKLGVAGYYSPLVPLEFPQGSQEQGGLIRWWSRHEENAGPAGQASSIHVRFWNGLGLSSEGFLEKKSEFVRRWREKEEQGLNPPADTSPFAFFMKGMYHRLYK